MEATFDQENGAGYIYVLGSPGDLRQAARTEPVPAQAAIDYDESGQIIGVELILDKETH